LAERIESVLILEKAAFQCAAGCRTNDGWGMDMLYALASYGHLGLAEKARATIARFNEQGRNVDFLFGAMREPYTDPAIRQLLSEGIRKSLSF
jgi:hypothetical protein